MRLLILVVAAVLGCGGGPAAGPAGPPPAPGMALARAYPATRWIPAKPSYAFAARTLRDAQRSARDLIDSFGMIAGVDVAQVSTLLTALVRVDALSADAVTAIGVDLEGGVAVFSESVEPTVVVHLTSPAQFQAFIAERNAPTQSVVVDGVEIFTATLYGKTRISWVVADDWLWVHLGLGLEPDGGGPATAWFSSSRTPGAPTWSGDWQWAQQSAGANAQPTVVGFVDLRSLIASMSSRIPSALACAQLVAPVGRVAVALDGSPSRASGTLSIDLGLAANGIAQALHPAPDGWAAVAAKAPLAVEWNVNLPTVRDWITPCAHALQIDLSGLDETGLRSARAFLRSFDPDSKSGSGAVSLDLTHKKFFAGLLDQVPLRSAFERKRTFGPYAGHAISVPTFPSLEYVLSDTIAIAGIGDGLLASVIGRGPQSDRAHPIPVFSLDVAPPGLSREAWTALLELLDLPSPDRVVSRLMAWADGHLGITLEGHRLVLRATGNRR